MASQTSPLAGQAAPPSVLVDLSALVAAYHSGVPDPDAATQRVSFGTSGHRGSSLDLSFNERHVLAITQATCWCRKGKGKGIDGPLFMGIRNFTPPLP